LSTQIDQSLTYCVEKDEPSNSLSIPVGSGKTKNSPYSLIGSMDDAGMGPIIWWDGEEAEEEEEAMAE
tara:strand:+ start:1799 stop:2002 length:204 start_codon:yes stop_codon:yes gene_type:complete